MKAEIFYFNIALNSSLVCLAGNIYFGVGYKLLQSQITVVVEMLYSGLKILLEKYAQDYYICTSELMNSCCMPETQVRRGRSGILKSLA